MRISIMGAGAVGSLAGALLSQRHEVTLIGRKAHVEAIEEHGLQVTGATRLLARPHAVASAREAGPAPDALLLTVKAYDTERALRDAAPLLGPRTAVLSLQNGVGNLEQVEAFVGEARALAAVTTHGVTFVAPGHVHHAGVGTTLLGPAGPAAEARAEELARALTECGLRTELAADIRAEIWAKAVVNAGINPLTAITGLRNGALLELPALRELMEATVREAQAIAQAAGIALPAGDLVDRARRVAQLTAENKSSMLQDVERGRRTEIDSICGAVVQRARGLGMNAPLNGALLALVRGVEASTRLR